MLPSQVARASRTRKAIDMTILRVISTDLDFGFGQRDIDNIRRDIKHALAIGHSKVWSTLSATAMILDFDEIFIIDYLIWSLKDRLRQEHIQVETGDSIGHTPLTRFQFFEEKPPVIYLRRIPHTGV